MELNKERTDKDGYVYGPPTKGSADDYQYWLEHGRPNSTKYGYDMYNQNKALLLDVNVNTTPEKFEESKQRLLKQFKEGKNKDRPDNKWIAREIEKIQYQQRANQFVSTDKKYQQPIKSESDWNRDKENTIKDFDDKIERTLDFREKNRLKNEKYDFLNKNASYDTYKQNEERKEVAPTIENGEQLQQAVQKREEAKTLENKLDFMNRQDDYLKKDIQKKLNNLKALRTGNPIEDEQVDLALSQIHWGEVMREQIDALERKAVEKGMDLKDYYESLDPKPTIVNAEEKVEEDRKEIERKINDYKHSAKYIWDQIKKIGLFAIDIGSNFLPYVIPVVGSAIMLGYQAFAPSGSIYHTEGSVEQKFANLGVNAAQHAITGLFGFGKTNKEVVEHLIEQEKRGGRGQASGFIMRMMAENKLKHKGQYRNPSNNDYGSKMRKFVAFDYDEMNNPSDFITEHFSGAPVPFISRRAEKRAEDKALASIRASKMSKEKAREKMEQARVKIGQKPEYQILYNAFRRYVM